MIPSLLKFLRAISRQPAPVRTCLHGAGGSGDRSGWWSGRRRISQINRTGKSTRLARKRIHTRLYPPTPLLVEDYYPGRRRAALRPDRLLLRPRGQRARRSGGHGSRGPQKWPYPSTGRHRQNVRFGDLHRLGWLGRPGRTDRANRLGARFLCRPVATDRRTAAAHAGRLRGGSGDRRYV